MDKIRSDYANSELMKTHQRLDKNSSKNYKSDYILNNRINSKKNYDHNRTLTLTNNNKYSHTNSPDSSNHAKLRNSQQLTQGLLMNNKVRVRHETKTEIYNKLFGWQPS